MTEHERELNVLGQLWSGAPLSNEYLSALEKLTDPYQDVKDGGLTPTVNHFDQSLLRPKHYAS